MEGPVPISNRFANSINTALTELAGPETIQQNRELLTQIDNALQGKNNTFGFLNPYIALLDQPENRELTMFLSLVHPERLQGILYTIIEDPGSAEPAAGQRGWHGRWRGRRGRRGRPPRGRGDPGILWPGFEIHGQREESFNRRVVRFEGMRDRLSFQQYYCILRNPFSFDMLTNPVARPSVGVFLYSAGQHVPHPDGMVWEQVATFTWEHAGSGTIVDRRAYQCADLDGWIKRVYRASDIAGWNVLHYIDMNESDITSMDTILEQLVTRFNQFTVADDGRLQNIIDNLPPDGDP